MELLFNQIGVELLALLLLGIVNAAVGLRCYECLSLTCESPVICESIIRSMQDPLFYPKAFHVEFQPNTSCPMVPINGTSKSLNSNASAPSSTWTNLSRECLVEDSACLEATIEVTTTFNGLRNSLELDPYSTLASTGYIRACASRKYLKSRQGPTITYRDEVISNSTLADIVTSLGEKARSSYVIKRIHSHEFYIDQGTEDAVTCYQNNCNDSTRRNRNSRNGAAVIIHNVLISTLTLTLVLISTLK